MACSNLSVVLAGASLDQCYWILLALRTSRELSFSVPFNSAAFSPMIPFAGKAKILLGQSSSYVLIVLEDLDLYDTSISNGGRVGKYYMIRW